jgi:osmoprotectant transport system ATP-binding protein
LIQLDTVTKKYDSTVAVRGLSLEVRDGEVCVLIGPSGCGKTTTLRMINRLIEPTKGRVIIDGKDTHAQRPEVLRRSIGYAIQSVGLFPHMTVAENIGVVPHILQWEQQRIDARTAELLQLVGLKPATYAAKYPAQLSGGEAQRIGVARALAADPPILLMDEPFGAVDPLTRERLQQQKTVVLVTHDLDEAIRLADRIAVMRKGELVQYDTPEELLAHPKDKFVHDFVGTDRALKRLSRLSVTTLMKEATSVLDSDPEKKAATRYVWVVNKRNILKGWLDTRDPSGNKDFVPIDLNEVAIPETASLREALSRMLGQGVRNIPVVDGEGHLLGEVTLGDVEEATASKDE